MGHENDIPWRCKPGGKLNGWRDSHTAGASNVESSITSFLPRDGDHPSYTCSDLRNEEARCMLVLWGNVSIALFEYPKNCSGCCNVVLHWLYVGASSPCSKCQQENWLLVDESIDPCRVFGRGGVAKTIFQTAHCLHCQNLGVQSSLYVDGVEYGVLRQTSTVRVLASVKLILMIRLLLRCGHKMRAHIDISDVAR